MVTFGMSIETRVNQAAWAIQQVWAIGVNITWYIRKPGCEYSKQTITAHESIMVGLNLQRQDIRALKKKSVFSSSSLHKQRYQLHNFKPPSESPLRHSLLQLGRIPPQHPKRQRPRQPREDLVHRRPRAYGDIPGWVRAECLAYDVFREAVGGPGAWALGEPPERRSLARAQAKAQHHKEGGITYILAIILSNHGT